MSIQNKPDYKVFASDAKSGEIETFPDILRGWGVTIDRTGEIPPMEWFNAIGKRADEWLLYLTQRGIPEWDSSLSYPKTATVQRGGVFYVSIKENKGEQPDNSQASWSTLGVFLGLGNYYNKTESDAKYQPNGNYATKEELNSGLDLKLSKDSIEQSPGVATNKVMSQAGVTSNFTSRENFSTGSSDAWMRTPNKKSVIQITDGGDFNFLHDSNYAFSVSPNGEISNGSINASKVTGLFSKYTDVTSQRSRGTTYTNPNNKPLFVSISFGNTNGDLVATVNGVVVYSTGNTSDGITRMSASFIVPPGGTYKVESPAGFNLWSECV